MDASNYPAQMNRDVVAGYEPVAAELAEQSRLIAGLTAAIEEVRRSATGEERGGELGYRFDAYPKWLEGSGWKDQSRKHRGAWPALRRLLELERWPGAAIRLTYSQLADYLCVSEDTAKRRLRDLADELGAIELQPGTGRSPSVVVVKHPIETPLKYDEVPWEAGGLAGAPVGYLESLRGAKQHYAELYGAKLPSEPAASGKEALEPESTEEPEPACGTRRRPSAEKTTPVGAPPGGADCSPLETRENHTIDTLLQSDTQEDRDHSREQEEDKKREKEKVRKKIEIEIKAQSPNKIGSEGQFAALALAEAVGRYDEIARVRLAQAAQYLISRNEVPILQVVTARIARARRRSGIEIRDPLAYVARVIQDVRSANELTAEERELAASVALASSPVSEQEAPAQDAKASQREEERRKRWRDYEWFFDPPSSLACPEQSSKSDTPEPEPWEGSPFAGAVPPERWWQPATPELAGAIRRRIVDLAAAGDTEQYKRAREELYAASWVGVPFKERVVAYCDKLIQGDPKREEKC